MTIDPNAQSDVQKTAELNHAQMRKGFEEERKARLAAEERLAQLEQEKQSKFKASLPYKDDEDDESEPYVDHRKLNKKFAQFEQTFEKKVDAMAEQKARSMIEQERQNSFLKQNPDFEQVLSQEMLRKFAEKHPEIAEPMLDMPDNFSRQKLLYQNIKALGVNQPDRKQESIQETIDKNRRSPYYQPGGGNSPPYAGQGDFSQSGQKNAYSKMKELISNRRG